MTIALATTADRRALAPFGHGATTLLAELEGDRLANLRELPPVEGCCGAVAQAIAGCQAVLCTGVGRGAAGHLEAAGVAIVLSEAVDPAEAVRRWRAGAAPAGNAGCGCGGEGHGHHDHDHGHAHDHAGGCGRH